MTRGRACPDPDVSDAEWDAFKEDERYGSPEPPRLNDDDVADDEEDDEDAEDDDWLDEDEDEEGEE